MTKELTYMDIQRCVTEAFHNSNYRIEGVWEVDWQSPVRYSDPRINVVTNALYSHRSFDFDNPADMARMGSVIIQALDNFKEMTSESDE